MCIRDRDYTHLDEILHLIYSTYFSTNYKKQITVLVLVVDLYVGKGNSK